MQILFLLFPYKWYVIFLGEKKKIKTNQQLFITNLQFKI